MSAEFLFLLAKGKETNAMQMNFHRKLPIPKEVKEEYPLSEEMVKVKEERDREIREVFDGGLDKFILIIGPCSADHSEPVLEYISRLKRIEEEVSGKKYLEQIRIAKDIVHSRNENADIKRLVKGLMIESYLDDGAQGAGEHVFGKSITDPCLGLEKTEKLILDIADKL